MADRSTQLNLPGTDRCLGCGACVASCAFGAIRMESDEEGFQQVVVNRLKCIGCGRCVSVCPINNVKSPISPLWVGGVYAKDDAVRRESSSGGVFSLMAEKILDSGGCVWGAALNQEMKVTHVEIQRSADLFMLRGSKYVQSDMAKVFSGIGEGLKANRQVMFSGTPCQVAAIKQFIGDDPRLISVDVICFGVPSPLAWSVYRRDWERKIGSRIVGVRFRDKTNGWDYNMCIDFESGESIRQSFAENYYLKGFLGGLYNRRSCSTCPMRNQRSQSDVTIGDFWGISELFPEFSGRQGVSLVLANTQKGYAFVRDMLDGGTCVYRETTYEVAVKCNPSLVNIASPHVHRARFMRHLKEGRFDYGEISSSFLRRLLGFVRRCIKKWSKGCS